jgi:hypothetical protein
MKWPLLLALTATTFPCAAETSPAGPTAPVLVELFTSEGCSSCPPADAVLARLEKNPNAIVLAHHVDYWDSLGWPDPFSSSDATARQRRYGQSYTPEAVIDGQAEMIGSREASVIDAVATAAKRPHAKVALAATPNGAAWDVTAAGPGDVFLAIVQDHATVAVPRGENAGRTLEHVGIVRSLKKIAGRTTVTLPAPIAAPNGTTFSLVAFSEDDKHRVLGSARIALAR